MHKYHWSSVIAVALLALAPAAVTADPKVASVEGTKAAKEALTVEAIIQKHIAALGGEKLLRTGKTFSFTVSGEKMGKKFSKTVYQARPNLMRVDIQSDDGPMSKGFDGKVAWVKKGAAPAEMMTPEETLAMKSHAEFEEPLVDYAKKGTTIKLVGTSEVASKPAYELEVAFSNGETERQFIDTKSFMLVKRTWTGKDKDGKAFQGLVLFGDYKPVAGRMVNHSVGWVHDGKTNSSTVSNISYDKPIDGKLFAMPK